MADEPENLIIRLLQEMRETIARMDDRLSDIDERITDLVQRVDGNTLVFNLVAGVVHHHEKRITMLEENRG